jgi:hypothetical protein
VIGGKKDENQQQNDKNDDGKGYLIRKYAH